jgi:hypothetical protein
MSSGQLHLPRVLTHASRLLAICLLVLQITGAGIAGKFAAAFPDAAGLCLTNAALDPTPAQPGPVAPLHHHHDNDCCFLNFGELSPAVVAIIAASLTPSPPSAPKPSDRFFIHSARANPELSPLAPRAPPVARV